MSNDKRSEDGSLLQRAKRRIKRMLASKGPEEAKVEKPRENGPMVIRQGSPVCFEENALKVHWAITKACNYRCSYCYSAQGGYEKYFCSLEQAETAIRHIASANRSRYQVSLLGGEPTLHPYLAEIITMFSEYLGDRLEIISIITNGNISDKALEAINKVAKKTEIELKVSLHFEYVTEEKVAKLVEALSPDVSLTFLVMLHPGLFEKVESIFDALCALREQHPFDISINLLRERSGKKSGFDTLDSRYTEEHFAWKEAAEKRFAGIADASGHPFSPKAIDSGHVFCVDMESAGQLVSERDIDRDQLGKLTQFDFSGMVCCAGASVLAIKPDGMTRGMVCPLGTRKCNIYEENPFEDEGWIYPLTCTNASCNCSVDYRIPKFRDADEADAFISRCRADQSGLHEA